MGDATMAEGLCVMDHGQLSLPHRTGWRYIGSRRAYPQIRTGASMSSAWGTKRKEVIRHEMP